MVLARDLGTAIDIGPATTLKALKANGKKVVYRSIVCSLSPDKMADEMITKEWARFTESIKKLFGDSFKYEDFSNNPELESLETISFQPYEDDERGQPPAIGDNDEADPDTYNQYVGAAMMRAKVLGRKRQSDGTLLGKAHSNTILDTRTYEVAFTDGQQTELASNNVITQNMFAQCSGSKGNQYLLLAGANHQPQKGPVCT